jgi:hypothetical protein
MLHSELGRLSRIDNPDVYKEEVVKLENIINSIIFNNPSSVGSTKLLKLQKNFNRRNELRDLLLDRTNVEINLIDVLEPNTINSFRNLLLASESERELNSALASLADLTGINFFSLQGVFDRNRLDWFFTQKSFTTNYGDLIFGYDKEMYGKSAVNAIKSVYGPIFETRDEINNAIIHGFHVFDILYSIRKEQKQKELGLEELPPHILDQIKEDLRDFQFVVQMKNDSDPLEGLLLFKDTKKPYLGEAASSQIYVSEPIEQLQINVDFINSFI